MKKVLIRILYIILPLAPLGYGAAAQAVCTSPGGGHCVELAAIAQAQVPGLEFLRVGLNIGDIFSQLYIFGMTLVGISALIMLVIGGIIYLTSGDSESRAKTARDYMTNAILGLALALLSYLILFTINPDLVNGSGWTQSLKCLQFNSQPTAPPAGGFCR